MVSLIFFIIVYKVLIIMYKNIYFRLFQTPKNYLMNYNFAKFFLNRKFLNFIIFTHALKWIIRKYDEFSTRICIVSLLKVDLKKPKYDMLIQISSSLTLSHSLTQSLTLYSPLPKLSIYLSIFLSFLRR